MEIGRLMYLLPESEVSYYFGFAGFTITARDSLDEAQLGFSRHQNGEDLTGDFDGDWQKHWCVVGRDTVVGDPFFVDTSCNRFPVLTAMHGVGVWEPQKVSDTLSGFLSGLEYLGQQSKQRQELVEPSDETIVDRFELNRILDKLVSHCGESARRFWEEFIDQHQDWVGEGAI